MSTGGWREVEARGAVSTSLGGGEVASQRPSTERLAAAFEVLPMSLAVLARDGRILEVNRAWRRFGDANGLQLKDHGVGSNYLETTDAATGEAVDGAPDAAAGIRGVIAGERPNFELVYPCHSPEQSRWFHLRAVPMDQGFDAAALVCHEQITEEVVANSRLNNRPGLNEEELRTIVQFIPLGMLIYRLEDEGRLVLVNSNPAADRILGADTGALTGRTIEEAFPSLAATEIPARYREVVRSGRAWHTDHVNYDEGSIRGSYSVDAFRIGANQVAVVFDDVTHRRRTEQTIIDQNQFLSSAIESLTHPFFVVDADTYVIRLANSAAGGFTAGDRVTCYQRNHGRSEPCSGRHHPCPLAEVRRTGRAAMLEHTHLDANGQTTHVEVYGYPLCDDDGRVVQMIEYTLDVTARRRAERKLRQRNRELTMLNWIIAAGASDLDLESILEAACREIALNFELPVVLASLVTDDNLTLEVVAEFVTVGLPSLVGRTRKISECPTIGELRRHRRAMVFADARTDPRLAGVRDQIEERGAVAVLVAPLVVEDEVAGQIWMESHRPHVFSDEERSLAMTVAGQLGSTVAKLRLSQTRSRLQAAIEQTDDMVVITDPFGLIQYVNPAFERTAGYSAAEVAGRTTKMLSSPAVDPEMMRERDQAIFTGVPWRGRLIRRNKLGEDFIEDSAVTPIRDATGRIVNFVSVGRDVTESVELERQYRQAQKLESIGRLAGGVAHDFNNLLAAIIGYAELALDTLHDDHEVYDDVREIRTTAERAAELTGQLLTFARRQSVELRQLHLNELIPAIERMLRRIIGENIELITTLSPDLGNVLADRALMEQVLVNLAVNARDAMPNGGRLTIETAKLMVVDDDGSDLPAVPPGSYVLLRVADSGHGIDPEVMEHLFEPFVSTKGIGRGTGLGLAICFGIVTQFGGRIWADSTPGHGTTMSVLLPRSGEAEDEPAVPLSNQRSLPRGRETVLLVEDEASLRKLLRRVLVNCGYTVIVAADGQQGLELAQSRIETIGVLITDVVMPRLGGIDLAGLLRAVAPALPIVFMSGYTGQSSLDPELLDESTVFLQKPFTPERFAWQVREILDASRHPAG